MAKLRILIATPTYDGSVRIEYMRALLELTRWLTAQGIDWHILSEITTMLHVMRSTMATMALSDGFSHLLFADADVGFTTRTVERMLAADKAVIGLAVPYRTLPLHEATPMESESLRRVVSQMVPYSLRFATGTQSITLEDGICEVETIGTGLLLIRCDTLQALVDAGSVDEFRTDFPFNQWLRRPTYWDFFSYRTWDDSYYSEDYSFCRIWRACGGHVHALCDEEVMHVGPVPVIGRFLDRLQTGKGP